MKSLLSAMLASLFAISLSAAAAPTNDEQQTRTAIAERFPGVEPENVKPSPIPGLYEVAVGPVVVYASADGRYLVQGNIIDLQTDTNITETRTREVRARTLAELDENELIVFGKPDAAHTVTVFTDVSCTYCRKLHSQIEEYNRRGIRIRYAAYPRNGLASDTWQEMERVWCAKDKRHALTFAKLDREFESSQCETDAVMEEWQLGRMLGVRGTPAIFTADGKMIPGYLPPDALLKRLESSSD